MHELPNVIPDVGIFLALSPEELGAKVLFLLKARPAREQTFCIGNILLELQQPTTSLGKPNPYAARREDAALALCEALAWLEAQGLIVRSPDQDGDRGWRTLSRRARDLKDEESFDHYRLARLLPKELLHPSIADEVWGSFMRGEYDVAAFQAMRQVEIALREATGIDKLGVKLARDAFKPVDLKTGEAGALTEPELEAGEQQGMMDLFAGALGALKNPHSHRVVLFRSPADAASVAIFGSQLLRMIEARTTA